MKKKGKVRSFPGPRGPQQLPQPGIPGPGGPVVKQKITEIDWYKWRLAHQKEQTLLAKQNEIQRYKELLAREEENLKLRISLLKMENRVDIGHLNIGPGDHLAQEDGEYYVVRAPRSGPVPPINAPVVSMPVPPAPPEVPIPPVPSTDSDEEEGDEREEGDEEEVEGGEKAR